MQKIIIFFIIFVYFSQQSQINKSHKSRHTQENPALQPNNNDEFRVFNQDQTNQDPYLQIENQSINHQHYLTQASDFIDGGMIKDNESINILLGKPFQIHFQNNLRSKEQWQIKNIQDFNTINDLDLITYKPLNHHVKTCHYSEYGCCDDQITEAKGPNKQGCPCIQSQFGCCQDNYTPALGQNFYGCPIIQVVNVMSSSQQQQQVFQILTQQPVDQQQLTLQNQLQTQSAGNQQLQQQQGQIIPNQQVTPLQINQQSRQILRTRRQRFQLKNLSKRMMLRFQKNKFNRNKKKSQQLATPTNDQNTNIDCKTSQWGCCHDGFTRAQGPNFLYCPPLPTQPPVVPEVPKTPIAPETCVNSQYGCCQDLITPAQGPQFQGCAAPTVPTNPPAPLPQTCHNSQFGCCHDQVTYAQGPQYQGCPDVPCQNTEFGCCKDQMTIALGYNYLGCFNKLDKEETFYFETNIPTTEEFSDDESKEIFPLISKIHFELIKEGIDKPIDKKTIKVKLFQNEPPKDQSLKDAITPKDPCAIFTDRNVCCKAVQNCMMNEQNVCVRGIASEKDALCESQSFRFYKNKSKLQKKLLMMRLRSKIRKLRLRYV